MADEEKKIEEKDEKEVLTLDEKTEEYDLLSSVAWALIQYRDVIEVLLASGVVIETEPLPYSGVGRPPGPRYVLVQAAEGHSADEVDRDE